MKAGDCVYFKGFLHENSCKKGVDLNASFSHPKTQLSDRVPCISGGEHGQRGSCVLHRYPTTRELYKWNEQKRKAEQNELS